MVEVRNDRLQIDARRKSAANALVGQDRIVLVPADEVVVERVEAAEIENLLHLGTAAFVQPEIGIDDRFIDVAAFDGLPGGVVIGDDFEEDVLEVRLHAPEIGAAFEQDLLPRHTPHQLERSGTDSRVGIRGLEVALRIDVLRDGPDHREVRELRREHVLEGDDDGVGRIVGVRLCRIPQFERAGELGRLRFRIDDLGEREHDVARAHRRSIGEGGFRIEVEGVRLAVGRDLVFVR